MRSQNAMLRWPFPQTGSCDTTKKLLHKHVSSSAEKFFPFLPLPTSNLAMVALTEFRGRKTSPCKGAKLGETGSSIASLGSLEGGERSPLGGRFCCGPAMHRWREPLASPLQMLLHDRVKTIPSNSYSNEVILCFIALNILYGRL